MTPHTCSVCFSLSPSLSPCATNPPTQDLEHDVAELQAQIVSLRESMEAETLSKVDLQNNIQSLREELAFRKKIYEEVRLHRRVTVWNVGSVTVVGRNVEYNNREGLSE